MLSKVIILIVLSWFSALVLTLVFQKIAVYFALGAKPNPIVQNHVVSTPFLGGVAVYVAFIVGLTFWWNYHGWNDNRYLYLLIAFGGTMVALGLWDDLKGLSPLHKLLGQCAVAILGVAILGEMRTQPLTFLEFVLCVGWIVFTTNAINLMDVMDGLAAGTSAITFVGLAIMALIQGSSDVAVISLTFSAALIGFLLFNSHKARIFLGDAGSLLIGSIFGLLVLINRPRGNAPVAIAIMLLLFALPTFELFFVSVMRFRKGRPIWIGSPDHYSLRLLSAGWSVVRIVGISYAATTLTTTAAVLFTSLGHYWPIWIAIIPIISLTAYVWKRLAVIEVEW